ncbi:Josephin family protein [Actinidia rufa]|uniref:ubiquitinyl hydrolase 1 n=1 Tax=Actinidia rufa TaxID=165716 RepID=A0A7J0EB94_9ERIC|nr:Josephin family protein [Actinidia rufa]
MLETMLRVILFFSELTMERQAIVVELAEIQKLREKLILIQLPMHGMDAKGWTTLGLDQTLDTDTVVCGGLVLQKALEVWDLLVIPLNSPVAEPAQIDPELENAFICHLQDHWFCIRKVNGEWYNFNSLYAAPEHLSKFYLSAYLDTLKGFGWSIFIVRGNFPKECPITSFEASNGYGQWLLPEDAERITKSCNSEQRPHRTNRDRQVSDSSREAEMLLDAEDEDLKAAIAASLMDSSPAAASTAEVGTSQNENKNSEEKA